MAFTVKAVSDLAGVSIRTLHHYDEIGLLKPAQTSASGYRLYTEGDLERLQQVLFFRELGFSLQEIKEIINRPGFDRREALLDHKRLLLERQERLGRLIQSVDRALNAMERGIPMDAKAMFDGFDPSQYEEEARQRWGHSKEYQESVERTKRYTQADWEAIKQAMGENTSALAAMMDRDPADPEVQESGAPVAPADQRPVLHLLAGGLPGPGRVVRGRQPLHGDLRQGEARPGPLPA